MILAANGALPPDGGKILIRSGTVRLSSRERYDLPFIEVTSGGRLTSDYWGCGGTVAKLVKWGANTLDFGTGLTVTGETHVGKSVLRISQASTGTAGLVAVHTNFASQAEWEAFCGRSGEPYTEDLVNACKNLLAIGLADGSAKTELSPVAAYRTWTEAEKYLMGAYSGYIWNNDPTNKICSFAGSIADTAALWINDALVFKRSASSKDSVGKTHFVSVGECQLRPGPNSFRFFLGHRNSGSYGTRNDFNSGSNIQWAKEHGIMCREGAYGSPAATNYLDFAKLEDGGDGMLFTTTKDASEARIQLDEELYRPHFDNLRFDRDAAVRCTIDLGGIDMFRQNGFSGCPRIENGTMCITGTWSFDEKDIARHPVEVAAGAGVVFDDAKLSVSVAGYPRGDPGTVILRAEAGASVTGLPSVEAANPGIAVWEVKREERDGDLCLVLYGRLRGTVISFR